MEKPVSEFYRLNAKYFHSWCKVCFSVAKKRAYDADPEKFRKQARESEAKKRRQEEARILVESVKAGKPCLDCGGTFPSCAMDFDHLRDKKYSVSEMIRRAYLVDTIKREIEKCELVCSNCHRIRTHNRRTSQSSFLQ